MAMNTGKKSVVTPTQMSTWRRGPSVPKEEAHARKELLTYIGVIDAVRGAAHHRGRLLPCAARSSGRCT